MLSTAGIDPLTWGILRHHPLPYRKKKKDTLPVGWVVEKGIWKAGMAYCFAFLFHFVELYNFVLGRLCGALTLATTKNPTPLKVPDQAFRK